MIRLTILLCFGIFATMVIYGRDPSGAAGPATGVEVTRLDAATNLALAVAPSAATAGETSDATRIALDDQRAALEAALAATIAGVTPVRETPEPEVQVASTDASFLPAAEAPARDLRYVSGDRVNLRQGPSTSTAVIGQVTLGQEAEVLEERADGWVRIEVTTSGADGFIYGRFLSATPL